MQFLPETAGLKKYFENFYSCRAFAVWKMIIRQPYATAIV